MNKDHYIYILWSQQYKKDLSKIYSRREWTSPNIANVSNDTHLVSIFLFSRFITKALKLNCTECQNLIVEPAKFRARIQDDNELFNRLTINKDKGGLSYPTAFMVKVVTAAEKVVQLSTKLNGLNSLTINQLNYQVLSAIGPPPQHFIQHAKDTQHGCSNHYYTVVKNILERFLKTRQNHLSKRNNLSMHANKKRNKLTRLIIFSNQQTVNILHHFFFQQLCIFFIH